MVHILTITVKKIKQTFSKNTFQKQSKFGYYFRFTLFSERKNSRIYLRFIVRTSK